MPVPPTGITNYGVPNATGRDAPMNDNTNRHLRLDEILLFEGLVTEDQIRQALSLQKEHGGRLGAHLLRNGWVTETGLVRALARQLNCEGVILADRKIPQEALDKVPAKIAVARTVLPFAYDSSSSELKIACEDPTNEDLLKELMFIAAGCKVRLYVAAETSLRAAITGHYVISEPEAQAQGTKVVAEAQHQADTGKFVKVSTAATTNVRGAVLLVSDDLDADKQIRSILESAFYQVLVCDSADAAFDMIGGHKFHTVFVRDTVAGDYLDLFDRLRKISPRTHVRFYSSADQLLLDDEKIKRVGELHVKNLDLFTALLSSKAGHAVNHSGKVGQLVDRLCKHIGLPDADRLVVVDAAYIHDLSRFYYGEQAEKGDFRTQINLTMKLLDSLNYSPVVIGILRAMYVNLRDRFTKRLPIEMLGGNILTVVDIFCDNMSLEEKLSLDKFDKVRRKFNDLRGKLFLPEVAEAFLEMIQRDILMVSETLRYNQIILYGVDTDLAKPIASRLKAEGFRVIVVGDLLSLTDLFRRGNPDMLILMDMSEPAKVSALVGSVIAAGIDCTRVPTFVLTDTFVAAQMTGLLNQGIEDLISIDNNLNLLVVKIHKVRMRIEAQASTPHIRMNQNTVTGAMGNLLDMNLIDLLQALGPSRRTVNLIVSDGTDELSLYLQQGQIVHAKLRDLEGPDAVYEAIGWTSGHWNIRPVIPAEIPPANNHYPNESILMEGCRLLDERQRAARALK
jgi:DNA-binding response OmpR family regulator